MLLTYLNLLLSTLVLVYWAVLYAITHPEDKEFKLILKIGICLMVIKHVVEMILIWQKV